MASRLPDASRIKAAIRPADFYRRELPTMPTPKRETGWTSGGTCAFHADEHAGSFRVHLDSGAFRCFSCGTRGADVISFVQLRNAVSFQDALRILADAYGVRA